MRGAFATAAAAAAAVLALLATVAAGDPIDDRNDCFITQDTPSKPRTLSFCHKFNNEACCPPAMDEECSEMFFTAMDLGLACRLRGDVRDHPFAKLYCMPCDPDQPRYVRMEPFVPLQEDADAPWTLSDICDGAGCEYNFTGFDIEDNPPVPTGKREKTILICREWAHKEFGTSGNDNFLSIFKKCGIVKSSPCLDAAGEMIPDRDRYTCGDDLVIPNKQYRSIEEFLNTDSMGPPQLDGEFGFKLVSSQVCEDDDITNSGDEDDIQAGSDTDDEVQRKKQFSQKNPDCLRTAAQLMRADAHSRFSTLFNTAHTEKEVNGGEKCFNAAAAPAASSLLVATLAFLAAVLVAVLH